MTEENRFGRSQAVEYSHRVERPVSHQIRTETQFATQEGLRLGGDERSVTIGGIPAFPIRNEWEFQKSRWSGVASRVVDLNCKGVHELAARGLHLRFGCRWSSPLWREKIF